MKYLHKILKNKNTRGALEKVGKPFVVSQKIDRPISFGYKIGWLVIKGNDPKDIIAKIRCEEVCEANWESAFSYNCWARYFDGKVNRRYCYIGESGETLWNDGGLTKEERQIGLVQLPTEECENWEDCQLPDEEIVIKIARLWGVDPFLEKYKSNKSIGYLCKMS